MFNAFLFKIFGINLNVLYIAGCFCAFSIVSLIYFIAKRFLATFVSFAISVFAISIGVLNINLFNFIFPYSYAMLYGLVSFLASLFCLLKYSENSGKTLYLYLSCFFAGLCVANKYEFLTYFLVILFSVLKIKKLSLKEYYYVVLSSVFVPAFCFGILFLQGLRVGDLVSTLYVIKKMTQSQTLNYFYMAQGVYFNKKTIPLILITFFKFLVSFAVLMFGAKIKNKFLSIPIIFIALFLTIIWTSPAMFIFAPLFIVVFSLINFRKIGPNIPLVILLSSSILVSLKTFWGTATLNYGLFFICPLIIAFFALLFDVFKKQEFNKTFVGVYVLLISLILGYQNVFLSHSKQFLIKTARGQIYASEDLSIATNKLIEFVQKNTKKTDEVVIFPEGTFINFLTDRKTDSYYNSLIPLYFEVFGEEKFIKHFKTNMPEYIVFNSIDMSRDYYFENICNDYAFNFCDFVEKNYWYRKEIDGGFRYLIFQKK